MLFPESGDFYVYLHRKDSNREVFYVGKGKRGRSNSRHGRNNHWNNVFKKHGRTVEFCQKGISEDDAFLLEMWLIAKLTREWCVLCNISEGGDGPAGVKMSEAGKKHLSEMHKGEKSYRYDWRIFHFFNKKGEIFIGTRYELQTTFNVRSSSITNLIAGRIRSAGGWSLVGSDDPFSRKNKGEIHYAYDHTVHTFKHDELGEFTGTRFDFSSHSGCGQTCVKRIVSNRNRTAKGWRCISV